MMYNSPHEYSKIFAGTRKPFQGHQGARGDTLGDPCYSLNATVLRLESPDAPMQATC
jgi:hypothetical protein